MITQEELLDKYINHDLSADEKNKFDDLMQHDLEFRSKVEMYDDLLKGVLLSERNKIKEEVQSAFKFANADLDAFESDTAKGIRLNERESIKKEINNAMKESKIFQLPIRKAMALAAGLLILLIAVWWIFSQNLSIDEATENKIVNAIGLVEKDASSAGLADPDREYKSLLDTIFSISGDNTDEALLINERMYRNKNYDYKYHETRGIIFLKKKEWLKAKKAFERAVQSGDSCLSKLFIGLIDSSLNKKTLLENKICNENLLIQQILNQF